MTKTNGQKLQGDTWANERKKEERNKAVSGIDLVQAAITKYHRPDGLNNRNSGGWKSYIKVLANSVPSESILSGLWKATFSLPHMVEE